MWCKLLILIFTFVMIGCAKKNIELGKLEYERGNFAEARRAFEKDSNDPVAGYHLYLMNSEGQGVIKNKDKALEFLRRSSQDNHPLAMTEMGRRLTFGDDVEKDEVQGLILLNRAAKKGVLNATATIGNYYLKIDKKNPEVGLAYLRAAETTWRGKVSLAMYYEQNHGNTTSQPSKSFQYYRELIDAESSGAVGSAHARYRVAEFLYYGFGVMKDLTAAAKILEPDLETSSDAAAFYGWMLFRGEGVQRDPERAVRIWTESGLKRDAHGYARLGLGLAYSSGVGVAKDFQKAQKFFDLYTPYRDTELWKMLFTAQGLIEKGCDSISISTLAPRNDGRPKDEGTVYQTLAAQAFAAYADCLVSETTKKGKNVIFDSWNITAAQTLLSDAEKLGASGLSEFYQRLLVAKAGRGVVIGMTVQQVKASDWGRPQEINRTKTASETTEQWVYGGKNYLYFRNGILEVIQN
jgi:TPR repeat protein